MRLHGFWRSCRTKCLLDLERACRVVVSVVDASITGAAMLRQRRCSKIPIFLKHVGRQWCCWESSEVEASQAASQRTWGSQNPARSPAILRKLSALRSSGDAPAGPSLEARMFRGQGAQMPAASGTTGSKSVAGVVKLDRQCPGGFCS